MRERFARLLWREMMSKNDVSFFATLRRCFLDENSLAGTWIAFQSQKFAFWCAARVRVVPGEKLFVTEKPHRSVEGLDVRIEGFGFWLIKYGLAS